MINLNSDPNKMLNAYLSQEVAPLPKRQRDVLAEEMGIKPRYLVRLLDGYIGDPSLSRAWKVLRYALKNGWQYAPDTQPKERKDGL